MISRLRPYTQRLRRQVGVGAVIPMGLFGLNGSKRLQW